MGTKTQGTYRRKVTKFATLPAMRPGGDGVRRSASVGAGWGEPRRFPAIYPANQ
jgi:hypothetical protein